MVFVLGKMANSQFTLHEKLKHKGNTSRSPILLIPKDKKKQKHQLIAKKLIVHRKRLNQTKHEKTPQI